VEEASTRAAAATFGQKASSAGKRAVQAAVVDAHLHEAAFSEGYWCISYSPVALVLILWLDLTKFVCLQYTFLC